MNVVLEEAVEVYLNAKTVKNLGRTLLKGDNICLMRGLTDLVM
jgi:small nuclear ribonucleoprotein (snRNP)-like protein